MSPLDAARAALAEREGPACDALLFDDPAYRCRRRHGHDGEHGRGGDLAEHLRAALAEVDRLTAERDALQARLVTADDLARLADENIAALETRAVRAERELQCERSAPAPVPTPTHAFIGDANADCATCGLPVSHPSHRRTA